MAPHESLKRQIYLKVEVDMSIHPLNPIVNLKSSIVIFCNTSYELNSEKHRKKSHGTHLEIEWFRNNNTNPIIINLNNSNYRIEHSISPTISSKLQIIHIKSSNIGVYVCKFRSQNVTTVLKRSNSNIDFHLFTLSNIIQLNSLNYKNQFEFKIFNYILFFSF